MATPSDYITGTISLTNGSASFTGTATGWALAGFREGDTIIDITGATEYMGVIASIDANGAGTLTKPWEGPTLTDVAYRMRYQPDGSRVTAQARQLIELLGNGNLQTLAGLEGSANRIPMFIAPGVMGLVSRTELTSGVNYDAQVNTMAGRAAYNGADEGFAVLVSNTGDGRAAVYVKVSNASGDWSEPAYVTGPAVTLDVGSVTEVEFGTAPDVTLTPVGGGYEFDFSLPAAPTLAAGSVTTGDPGTSVSVDVNPVSGGYSIDFTIPAGEGFAAEGDYSGATTYAKGDVVQDAGSSWIALQATTGNAPPTLPTTSNAYWQLLAKAGADGDIDGVTPFWQGRILVDADAAAARAGLEVDRLPLIPQANTTQDFDALVSPGWHNRLVSGANANGPGSGFGYLHILGLYNGSLEQIIYPLDETSGSIKYRGYSSGEWWGWRELWDSGNLPIATQADAEAGDSAEPLAWAPEQIAQAIAALASGGGGGQNLLLNARGVINQRGYTSNAATSGANQYTLDRWRVVTSGQSLSWTESGGVRTMTAPAGGVEQVVIGGSLISGDYVLNWEGTATATVNGTARAKGEVFTLTGGSNATIRFSSGTFSKPKLEIGDKPTAFTSISEREDVLACQWYFRRITGVPSGTRLLSGMGTGGNNSAYTLPGAMRVDPTLSRSGLSVAVPSGANNTVTAILLLGATDVGVHFVVTAATTTLGELAQLRSTGTGDYLDLDAEIY